MISIEVTIHYEAPKGGERPYNKVQEIVTRVEINEDVPSDFVIDTAQKLAVNAAMTWLQRIEPDSPR